MLSNTHFRCLHESNTPICVRRWQPRHLPGLRHSKAAAFGQEEQPSRGGFFNRRKEQEAQEAARKSLEGMFQGKKDILASFDSGSGRGSGGGGGKKGTGGGGGGGWQPPNWRDLGGRFGKGAQGFSKAVLAILAFAGAILLIPVFPQVSALIVGGIRTVLRLDGRSLSGRRQATINAGSFAGTTNLGPHESAVISKYGGDTDSL